MKRSLLLLPLLLAACATEKADGRPWVHKLQLRGVKHVDEKNLRGKIAVEQKSWIPLSPKHYLNPFTLDIDKQRIEAYYREHGYFAAQVTGADVQQHNKESVDVQITIDEGPPTFIKQLELSGLDSVDAKNRQRAQKLRIKRGQVFDYDKYAAEKDRLAGVLKQHGYAWAEVKGQVDVDRDARLAIVKLAVTPGPWATFGTVTVQGTDRVRPDLVAERAQLPSGEPFSLDTIEEVRGRIYNLGIFASVKVEYVPNPQHPDIADVIISVHEGPFHELRLGGGVGLESERLDLHLSAVYTKRNFLGGLRTLRLQLAPAYVIIFSPSRNGPAGTAEAQFTQPDLFWHTQLKWTVGFDMDVEYAYQNYGPRTQLALHHDLWHNRVHLDLSYNFQYLVFFNTDPTILDDPSQSGRLFGYTSPYRLAWWEEDFALDLRDRPLDARRGGYLGVSVEEGGAYAGGAFQYEKVMPDLRGYLPLGKRVVVAARVEFGQFFTQGSLGSPITRRFYLGGPSSHRGFNYNRLSLQVPSGLSGVPAIPIGGDQMLLGQFELRVRLVRLFGSWLGAAGFVDAGDVGAPSCASAGCRQIVGNHSTNIDITNLHYATGAGLRYKTVIGTIRVDLGVRLNRLGAGNPDPGQRFAFHLSVGEAF